MSNTALDSDIVYWDPSYTQHLPAYSNPSLYVTSTYPDHWESSRYDSISNGPAIATPESANTSRQRQRKRKTEEKQYHEYRKRPRQEKTPENFMPPRGTSNGGQSHSATQYGTQHNPIEIESSPKQKSDKLSCIPPSPPCHDSGLFKIYMCEPDPAVNWPVYYAVARGRVPGLYRNWLVAEAEVSGYPGAIQKEFESQEEAWDFMDKNDEYSWHFSDEDCEDIKRVPLCPNETTEGLSMTRPTQHECMTDQMLIPSSPGLDTVDDFVPEPEPELSAEQKYVVDLIVEGGHNVFYTGSAGCGKSTILKAFVRKLVAKGKRVNIVAPTNLAALNVGGQTTWAYAGWTPDSLKLPLDKLKADAHKSQTWKRFDSTDVLVIDEISMVENLQFERLNEVMKAASGAKRTGPFGGVQIIVTGDFCQLSPVKPFAYCMGCGWELIHEKKEGQLQHRCENKGCRYDMWPDTDKWAFRSEAWKECGFEHINLTEIFRQKDQKFKYILQTIRQEGVILPNHARVLLNHMSETENAIKIYSLRRDVDRVNSENIRRLPSESRTYRCLDNFRWKPHHQGDESLIKYTMRATNGSNTLQQLKEHRYEACVELKEGMRVVLQSNLDPQSNLVNGTQGTIVGFELYDPKKLPSKASGKPSSTGERNACLKGPHAEYAEDEILGYAKDNRHPSWPIVEFDDGKTRTIYADCSYSELGNEEKRRQEGQPRQEPSLLSRTQIPLVAGYAITVHKSQGMTLSRVIVDLSAAFEASQIYVALSRARSLKGLKVLGLPRKNLGGANKQVKEFLETCLKPKKLLSGAALPSSQLTNSQQLSLSQVTCSELPSSSQIMPS
ncbi:hypothetical protein yc1106_09694 [Curvularia clavata]|uniref:ATP-dependent DNA helicase n=1 Tax=Curvularia clavata TaxID=95742 RepID=A0A9Q9DXX4_CURCL|nr:hypothetical protein yc1106_09694 [Curvularia clavata]